jgi:hypothetical protein
MTACSHQGTLGDLQVAVIFCSYICFIYFHRNISPALHFLQVVEAEDKTLQQLGALSSPEKKVIRVSP